MSGLIPIDTIAAVSAVADLALRREGEEPESKPGS